MWRDLDTIQFQQMQVVLYFAYAHTGGVQLMTWSSKPDMRRLCFATSLGPKLPRPSRAIVKRISPSTDNTVF